MVDAINERHGPRIWPDRLGAFLTDAARFPHVAVVLSCRSTYLRYVVPDRFGDEKLPRLDHTGFSTRDARTYLSLRGILLPDHPFLDAELHNPLFLKTCCDALKADGRTRFPKGIRGVSAVFAMFLAAVRGTIERRLGLNSIRRIPDRAINALAQEIERTRDPYIPFERAAEIVDPIYGGAGPQEEDLLFQLESEGVLSIEPVASDDGLENCVRFTFERFADHVVANAILEDTLVNGQLPEPLPAGSALVKACMRGGAPWGVREALAVQVPERTGIELPDVLSPFPDAQKRGLLSPETVRVRAPSSINKRTLKLLEEEHGGDALWEALVRLSIDPDGSFDAHWLHAVLGRQVMPERDGGWSIYVADCADDTDTEDRSAVRDLIQWAREIRSGEVEPDTARLAAITLTWCLTTSSRRARDTATMGLVCLLTAVPDAATELLKLFEDVNEPYVGERIAAAIYGAALQGAWSKQQLQSVGRRIAKQFFVRGPLPVDFLWRDHLSSLLRYAESRGCKNIIPTGISTQAPFHSPWPLEPVTDEEIKRYKRTYPSGYVSTDEIVSSTGEHGDFGRYIIESVVGGWSPAPRGTSPLPTTEALFYTWKAEFDSYSTAAMVEAFDAMNAQRDDGREWMYASGERAEKHRELEAKFRQAIGAERFERYRVMGRYWRPGLDWGAALSRPIDFDLHWARRWVCKRAHELGWREDLHGEFDRTCGHGRMEHMRERIGKKYQWIAFRELMARISDNCAATDDDWEKQYSETARRFRDIDPSRLIEASHDWGWASFHDATFWMPHVLKPTAMALPEAWDWLDGERDVLDGPEFIELAPDDARERWLPLSGFQNFRHRGTTMETEPISRETWFRLDCFVVRAVDEAAALDRLKDKLFLGSHDLGFDQDGLTEYFLGEHGWRNRSELDWTRWWGSCFNDPTCVEGRATTYRFRQEAGGYDHSLTQNFDVRLPAPWLLEALKLRLADGRNVRYVDEASRTVFFDPSVKIDGPSVALVQREPFLTVCEREGLVPIWVLGGAKEVYVQELTIFGRRNFTSVYTFREGFIRRLYHILRKESRREESDDITIEGRKDKF